MCKFISNYSPSETSQRSLCRLWRDLVINECALLDMKTKTSKCGDQNRQCQTSQYEQWSFTAASRSYLQSSTFLQLKRFSVGFTQIRSLLFLIYFSKCMQIVLDLTKQLSFNLLKHDVMRKSKWIFRLIKCLCYMVQKQSDLYNLHCALQI